ncbi:MAG: DUF1588 domain-containing protein [Planctomycetaceae bacterium]
MLKSLLLISAVVFALSCGHVSVADDAASKGEAIYRQACASCHGAAGEGTPDNYPEPLFGDQPTFDLAETISQTMPKDEADLCVGDDAKAVAEWMQTAFYSPEAQARLHPPRKSLSRLTVSQYRNAVADLIEGFQWTAEPNDQRGLTARYYSSRNFRDKDKVIERTDARIDFNFGEGTPDSEKIPNNEQFSIRWEGSLMVTETGWYDFIVRTENGVRLYVNDRREPLIDQWVKSGFDTEYQGRRFLLAGRLYPVNLEWFTFKEKTASIGLWWVPPHGVAEPIPARHLTTQNSPQVLVVETPFPPDDRSDGYIRGTSVSKEWDEATTFAAIETADQLVPYLRELAKVKREDNDEQRRQKLKDFCLTFAYRAFRRPLDDQQKQTYVLAHFADGVSDEDAVKRCVLAVLKSPRFLYREVDGQQDLYTEVERLSFALRDSIPTPNLLQAAEKEWVKPDKALRDQAWALLNTYRGRTRLLEFLRVWMNVERLEQIDRNPEHYPDFNPRLVADLRTSLELLLQETVSTDDGAFRNLLTGDQVWMNDHLAAFYHVTQNGESVEGISSAATSSGDFVRVLFEPEHRAGIISHPFLMAGFAYHDSSSPIHRGVFLSRGILGRALKAPPDSVAPLPPDLEPTLNTRERVARQTSPAMCANCHRMINSLGFALEEFDAVGRLRSTEKDRPVDSSGHYLMRDGTLAEFQGANQLADFLLNSQETHRSFSRQLFHHMIQQPILAYGPDTIQELADFFEAHGFSMRHLMVEIAFRTAREQAESQQP